MALSEWKRKLWHPTYGKCGGASLDCAVAALDPMDALFYRHDNDLAATVLIEDEETRAFMREKADFDLHSGLRALTDEDFKKIPAWVWKPPFLKRWYAKRYREACLKVFK